MAKDNRHNFGTFEKDGETRIASSQDRRIQLLFDGWTEKKAPSAEAMSEVNAAFEGENPGS